VKIHCHHSRLHIGGEPQSLPPEVREHLTTCAECSRFLADTLAMDGGLRGALELPLDRFAGQRRPAAMPRRFALAASVVLALLIGGGFWLSRPQSALAGDLIEHVSHEPGSWQQQRLISPPELAALLGDLGVRFDTRMPVTYAAPCLFRGRAVPHLVVQTDQGLVTVMLLSNEKVSSRQEFAEGPYRGVLLPARQGSVAVIARGAAVPDAVADQLLSGLR
jgi:anti-sigma factor RsiW